MDKDSSHVPLLMHQSSTFSCSAGLILPLQVLTRSGVERYSTAFFLEPNFDTVIDPSQLPACCPPGTVPTWQPITSGQYLLDKYAMTHANFINKTVLVAKYGEISE